MLPLEDVLTIINPKLALAQPPLVLFEPLLQHPDLLLL